MTQKPRPHVSLPHNQQRGQTTEQKRIAGKGQTTSITQHQQTVRLVKHQIIFQRDIRQKTTRLGSNQLLHLLPHQRRRRLPRQKTNADTNRLPRKISPHIRKKIQIRLPVQKQEKLLGRHPRPTYKNRNTTLRILNHRLQLIPEQLPRQTERMTLQLLQQTPYRNLPPVPAGKMLLHKLRPRPQQQ